MESITKEYINVIDDDMAKQIINLGSRELTLANVNSLITIKRDVFAKHWFFALEGFLSSKSSLYSYLYQPIHFFYSRVGI